VCAALVVVASGRWWAPIFSVLISLWIVVGGWAAGKLTPNLVSANPGTVAGNAVMVVGLVFAAVTGVVAMVTGSRR
jgi:predicted nicotinamide N-methyase